MRKIVSIDKTDHVYGVGNDEVLTEALNNVMNIPDFLKDALRSLVPTEPGKYVDSVGREWVLTEDGHWYDESGVTNPPEVNFILGLDMSDNPWVKVD